MTFIPGNTDVSNPYGGMSSPIESINFPETFSLSDAREMLDEIEGDSKLLLGVSGDGKPQTVDLDADSPHVLVNAATGGGKSVVIRGLASQIMAKGGNAVFLDLKQHSHQWAKDHHRAGYAKTLPDIGNALVELGREVHRRNQIVEEWTREGNPMETAPVGARLAVVFEEMNATMEQLKEMSRRIPRGTYDALDAFRDLLFLGRAAKVHVLAVAQFADAKAMGGGAIRENFSTRILLRYSKNAWTMLLWDCGLPQSCPEQIGRGMVGHGGKAKETQFLFTTEKEARAMSGARLAINA